jgi:hypothetical protein
MKALRIFLYVLVFLVWISIPLTIVYIGPTEPLRIITAVVALIVSSICAKNLIGYISRLGLVKYLYACAYCKRLWKPWQVRHQGRITLCRVCGRGLHLIIEATHSPEEESNPESED